MYCRIVLLTLMSCVFFFFFFFSMHDLSGDTTTLLNMLMTLMELCEYCSTRKSNLTPDLKAVLSSGWNYCFNSKHIQQRLRVSASNSGATKQWGEMWNKTTGDEQKQQVVLIYLLSMRVATYIHSPHCNTKVNVLQRNMITHLFYKRFQNCHVSHPWPAFFFQFCHNILIFFF